MNTHRYGSGRWHCTDCGYTFRPFKKRKVDRRWLESYLLDGSSLRRLGQRWHVGHMTAWRRIQRTQDKRIQLGKLITRNITDKVDVLMLDAKHFLVHRCPYTLYVAINGKSGRPLCWILLPRYELRKGYEIILAHLKRKNCSINAVVSDWHKGIIASVHDCYPDAIHQRCATHVLQHILRKLGGRWFIGTENGKKVWSVIRRIAIGFDHIHLARMYMGRMRKKYSRYEKAFRILDATLSDIYQFEKQLSADIPHTSNRIENFMGQLEQRLKTMRGIKTPDTLIEIITSLIKLKCKKPTKK